MNEEIVKLARNSGLTCYGGSQQSSGHHSWHAYTQHLEAFYRAAYNEGIKAAARIAYGTGDEQMEAQIRMLEKK